MVKFVRVRFKNSSKLYDYICELDNVKKGDFVYVCTRDGMEQVEVRGIFYSEFKDMPLSEYAYKKVEGRSRKTNFGPYAKGAQSARKRKQRNRKFNATFHQEEAEQKGSEYAYRVNTTYDSQQPSENNNDDASGQKKNTLQDKICLLFLYALFALYVVMFIWGLFTEEGARARAFMQDFNDFAPRR